MKKYLLVALMVVSAPIYAMDKDSDNEASESVSADESADQMEQLLGCMMPFFNGLSVSRLRSSATQSLEAFDTTVRSFAYRAAQNTDTENKPELTKEQLIIQLLKDNVRLRQLQEEADKALAQAMEK